MTQANERCGHPRCYLAFDPGQIHGGPGSGCRHKSRPSRRNPPEPAYNDDHPMYGVDDTAFVAWVDREVCTAEVSDIETAKGDRSLDVAWRVLWINRRRLLELAKKGAIPR